MQIKTIHLSRRLIVVILSVTILACLIVMDYLYHRQRIYQGVYLSELSVGGLTLEEARLSLIARTEKERYANIPLFFSFEEETWSFSCLELGVAVDVERSVYAAYSIGRGKFFLFQYPARIHLLFKGENLPFSFRIDEEKFNGMMTIPGNKIMVVPLDARFKLVENNEKVEIIPDEDGREIDIPGILKSLRKALVEFPNPSPVELAIRRVTAGRTADTLSALQVNAKISSFETVFSAAIPNRVHNISLAAMTLDDTLIMPGEVFSFNESVGEASAECGYKSAPIILSGELSEGTGGGICQVSSTLYNAILLADLEIVERANHGLAIAYLPPGRDATVAYGWRDLKFFNDKDHAVWLKTFIEGNRLIVSLYGDPIPGREVVIQTRDLQTIPKGVKYIDVAELPTGHKEKVKNGQPGYNVSVWRVVTFHGEEIKREKLSQDYYKPVPDQYKVGTGSAPVSLQDDSTQEFAEEVTNQ